MDATHLALRRFRHKHGENLLIVAPTRLKVSFTFRLTRLLLYRLLLIADSPAVTRPGKYQRNIQNVKVLFFGEGKTGFEPAMSALAEPDIGQSVSPRPLGILSRLQTPFGVGALLPLGIAHS